MGSDYPPVTSPDVELLAEESLPVDSLAVEPVGSVVAELSVVEPLGVVAA
jgi:hypothetical protein